MATSVNAKRKKVDEYSTDPAFVKMLCETSVMELHPKKDIMYITSRDSHVIDVWRGLVTNHFLSVPVIDTKGMNKEKYYGFFELADIISYLVKTWGERNLKTERSLYKLMLEDERFKQLTIRDLMATPRRTIHPFASVMENYSLFTAMEMLAKNPQLHRVAVMNPDNVVQNIITESRVLEYLQRNIGKLGSKKNRPVGEMMNVQKPVFSITENDPVMKGFHSMCSHNVSGVAVMNEIGDQVVGAMSWQDLKLIIDDDNIFNKLYLSVKAFLAKLNDKDPRRAKAAITVTLGDTLEHCIELVTKHHIHRLFVTSSEGKDGKLMGVVGLKEILNEVLRD